MVGAGSEIHYGEPCFIEFLLLMEIVTVTQQQASFKQLMLHAYSYKHESQVMDKIGPPSVYTILGIHIIGPGKIPLECDP